MKPTQEQAIAWAKEAWGEGKVYCITSPKHWHEVEAMFVRLANLAYEAGRKDENEECEKVCDELENGKYPDGEAASGVAWECASAIRARREHG